LAWCAAGPVRMAAAGSHGLVCGGAGSYGCGWFAWLGVRRVGSYSVWGIARQVRMAQGATRPESVIGAGTAATGSHAADTCDPDVAMPTVGVHGPATWDLTVAATTVGAHAKPGCVCRGRRWRHVITPCARGSAMCRGTAITPPPRGQPRRGAGDLAPRVLRTSFAGRVGLPAVGVAGFGEVAVGEPGAVPPTFEAVLDGGERVRRGGGRT
jgi:hypothetical protein